MRRWPKSARPWWRPVVAAHGRVACGGTPRLGAKKSVHATERDAERVVELRHLFRARRRDARHPDLPPLRSCPGRSTAEPSRAAAGRPEVTLIVALTPNGLGALLRGDGAVNGNVFAAYLDQVLGPNLRPGDVVVFNNLLVYQVDGLNEIAKNTGYACATCHLARRILT